MRAAWSRPAPADRFASGGDGQRWRVVAGAMEERAEEPVRLEADGLRDGCFLATPATCDWPRVDIGPAAST